jgi:hypothetical protein
MFDSFKGRFKKKQIIADKKAKAKERHPSSPKKTTTKKVEKNGK